MEENTEEEPIDSLPNTQSDNSSDEIIPAVFIKLAANERYWRSTGIDAVSARCCCNLINGNYN